jgi:small subunit ribosomal protein S3
MGQKVNPRGIRVGVIKDWDSKWFANKKDFSNNLVEDFKVRKYVKKALFVAGVAKVEIERRASELKLNVYTAKPGMALGKNGEIVNKLKADLGKMTNKEVIVNVLEVKVPDIDAQLVAENISGQLERRISYRKAMKQCMAKALKAGAKGIKTSVSGRLGGAEIARTEFYREGTIPLQTLRADIDYGFYEADTTYGKIGVKVWIYKGEVLPTKHAEGGRA